MGCDTLSLVPDGADQQRLCLQGQAGNNLQHIKQLSPNNTTLHPSKKYFS